MQPVARERGNLNKTLGIFRDTVVAKIITKMPLKQKCFCVINFVKITRQRLYKAKSLACSLANRDTSVAARLQSKSSGGTMFLAQTKLVTKGNVPRNYVTTISARMAMRCSSCSCEQRHCLYVKSREFLFSTPTGLLPRVCSQAYQPPCPQLSALMNANRR